MHRDAGAVIVGDAGIGELDAARCCRLRARGISVEFVLATEAASTVPFGALAGLLDRAPEASGDLLDVLRTAGDRLASRGPLALIVDDAHRLDPASAALLLQLVTRHRVRVLATVRARSRAPDAVTSLWKDAGLMRVDLEPLSEDAASDIARDLLDGPVERETLRWLNGVSAGNPLFLRELIRSGKTAARSRSIKGIGDGPARSRRRRGCLTCSTSASMASPPRSVGRSRSRCSPSR